MKKREGKVRIGIIGCGRISDLHARGYAACPDAEVYAVCDADPSVAEKRKLQWNALVSYTDYRELLSDPAVDAVDILTPHILHEEMAIASLEAGKHTAVQKPMTINLASADRMISAAEKSGLVFKVTENYIFYPPIVKAAEYITSGALGELQNIRIHLIAGGSGGWEIPNEAWVWRMKEFIESRGMETFDHGHHLWSTAWFLMGPFREVSAWIGTTGGMVDAPAVLMWKHASSGVFGTCSFTYGNHIEVPSDYYANDEWVEVTGSEGILRINRCTGRLLPGPPLSLFRNGRWEHIEDIPSDWQEGFTGAAANFVASIRGTEKPHLSGAEAREIMAMNMAVQKSSDLQRSVFIEELDSPSPEHRARLLRKSNRAAIRQFKAHLRAGGDSGTERKVAAGQARELTLALKEKIDVRNISGWKARIGLELTGTPEEFYAFDFSGTDLVLQEGSLPEDPDLLVAVSPAVWVSILLRKKKMQTAFFQGKLKLKGNIDYAMKLKEILGL